MIVHPLLQEGTRCVDYENENSARLFQNIRISQRKDRGLADSREPQQGTGRRSKSEEKENGAWTRAEDGRKTRKSRQWPAVTLPHQKIAEDTYVIIYKT